MATRSVWFRFGLCAEKAPVSSMCPEAGPFSSTHRRQQAKQPQPLVMDMQVDVGTYPALGPSRKSIARCQ